MKRLKDLDNYLNHLLDSLDNRISLEELNEKTSDFLGFNVNFEKVESVTDDFRLALNLFLFNDKELYIDIYYLSDNNGMLYITDYELDSVHALNKSDLNQLITDGDQDLSKNSAYAFYIDNIDRFDEIASVLKEKNLELHGWFYTLIDEIKNVNEKDFPLGG